MADITRFNSQPPEGGWGSKLYEFQGVETFQLTAARRRLEKLVVMTKAYAPFQLTAARRRLDD